MARRFGDDVSWIAARQTNELVRPRVALLLFGWHGRRLLRHVP
jgi:hypothetical protein